MYLRAFRWFLGCATFGWVALMAWLIIQAVKHPCIRSHEERVYVEETTTYITIGGFEVGDMWMPEIRMPVIEPAHWETQTVCDERKR